MDPITENSRSFEDRSGSIIGSAIQGEIESVVLARMNSAGGNLAHLARFRSFFSEALGLYGTVTDIIDMAVAGYEAMTINSRMLMRVSAAHGFGYWIFQDRLRVTRPSNPPNSFLVMHRESDRRDQGIGSRTGNQDFSSDGGLTSADWNIIWQRGFRNSLQIMDNRARDMHRSGVMQRSLQNRMSRAQVFQQSYAAIASQYRSVILAPKFISPAAAAGGYFLSSLHNASGIERDMNLRLYRQFPYNPTTA